MDTTVPGQKIIEYCLYARKSTEDDERQAMSIDSQIKEMSEMAVKEGLFIKEIRKESHSAKLSGQRPVFNQLLNDLRNGIFTGILTWAPDINPENKPVHFMDYAKYIFRNGTMQEKREVTSILNRPLYIHNETVTSVPLIT